MDALLPFSAGLETQRRLKLAARREASLVCDTDSVCLMVRDLEGSCGVWEEVGLWHGTRKAHRVSPYVPTKMHYKVHRVETGSRTRAFMRRNYQTQAFNTYTRRDNKSSRSLESDINSDAHSGDCSFIT